MEGCCTGPRRGCVLSVAPQAPLQELWTMSKSNQRSFSPTQESPGVLPGCTVNTLQDGCKIECSLNQALRRIRENVIPEQLEVVGRDGVGVAELVEQRTVEAARAAADQRARQRKLRALRVVEELRRLAR